MILTAIAILFLLAIPYLLYRLFKWIIRITEAPKKVDHKPFRPKEFETHSEYQDYLNDMKQYT
jgi:hypothetical protein